MYIQVSTHHSLHHFQNVDLGLQLPAMLLFVAGIIITSQVLAPAGLAASIHHLSDLTSFPISVNAPTTTPKMPNILIVGATRGLGAELAKHYAANSSNTVTGTARSTPKDTLHPAITWISGIDIATEPAGRTLVSSLKGAKQDVVVVVAGFFPKETFEAPDWEAELQTYKVCAMGPLFVVQRLAREGLFARGAKVVLVSSEAGSIALRHESEGGSMYAHHGSKAALNSEFVSCDL